MICVAEGSPDEAFGNARIVCGRIGEHELFVGWLWGSKRHIAALGSYRGHLFTRHASWIRSSGR
jgi:hypothetical protein